MGKFKESRTAKNLLTSYAFESQAHTRYRFFSDKAETDELIQIAAIFKETAEQEFEHALRFFKFFNEGELEITASFLTGAIRSTYDNLMSSATLEHKVHTNLYPTFAAAAREENYQRAADTWDAIIVAERHHEHQFLALAQNLKNEKAFRRDDAVMWRCMNCGYIHEGNQAPEKCPACVRSSGYFELLTERW